MQLSAPLWDYSEVEALTESDLVLFYDFLHLSPLTCAPNSLQSLSQHLLQRTAHLRSAFLLLHWGSWNVRSFIPGNDLSCRAVNSFLKLVVQLDYHSQFCLVHHSPRMRHHFVKLFEVLLFQQEHHVVGQDECVAWTDVDSLFKSDLCVVNVGDSSLKSKGQIAKGFFVVRLNLKCI